MSSPRLALTPQAWPAYRFQKVEDFYSGYRSWPTITTMLSWQLDTGAKILSMVLGKSDGTTCAALVHFLHAHMLRLRFNPGKGLGDFSPQNSRSIVMDTTEQLRRALEEADPATGKLEAPFTVEAASTTTPSADIMTKTGAGQPSLKLTVRNDPFSITIADASTQQPALLWESDIPAMFFAFDGNRDYSIAFAVRKAATASYIGFGEQGGKRLVKNTTQVNFFNYDNMRYSQVYNNGPRDAREPLYHSDPFFMEFNRNPFTDCVTGHFIDNSGQSFVDIGYSNSSRYVLGTRFADLDLYFIAGKNAGEVLKDFSLLAGRSRLKPRYALGYHQGCYGYENWNDVLEAVNKYRAARIPIDGIHIDVDVQNNYQTFTVDESPNKFPNAQQRFTDLRNLGIKCSTNITPIISNRHQDYTTYTEGLANGYFVKDTRSGANDPEARQYQKWEGGQQFVYPAYDPENNFNLGHPYIGEVYYGGDRGTTGHYPDLGRSEVRHWWGSQYQHLFNLGLEMVWQDMTTPAIRDSRGDMKGFPFRLQISDDSLSNVGPQPNEAIRVWNLYAYNLHKATYHGLNHLAGRDNKRNFIVGRGSFTGMHRFAALWTGDNASSWEFLQINVAQVLSLGLCGVAIAGEDIGGFESEHDWQHWVDPELLVRWTIAGAFLPWFRNHYIRKGRKYFQEPYAFGDVDLSNITPIESRKYYSMVLPICKLYIERRYRFLQLFYDAMWENTLNGMPICRSMILTDPQDKALYNDKIAFLSDQFMLRKDVLIAPVLEPEAASPSGGSRDIYVPAGSNWYCYMDNRMPLGASVEGGTTLGRFGAQLYVDGNHEYFVLPTYIRAGAIVPTIEIEQHVGERARQGQPNPITLNVYPGANGEYTMYLDDGVSRSSAPKGDPNKGHDDAAKSEYREVHITHTISDGVRTVRLERVHDGYNPLEDYYCVAFLQDPNDSAPVGLSIGGSRVEPITGGSPETRANQLAASSSNAWYYNENIHIAFVKLFDNASPLVVELK